MASLLDDEAGVLTQLLVFGYAVTGDVGERAASYAERVEQVILPCRAWDRTARDLSFESINGEPVPESWALPWVTEAKLREILSRKEQR